MKRVIATIGYEGASIAALIATLRRAKIDVLVDVREVALSRRKGFSKSQLSTELEAKGFRYVHLRGLGDPKEGRDAARAGDFRRFKQIFAAHLRTDVAQADLMRLVELISTSRACLMCYEALPAHCHRSIVADALASRTGLPVKALYPQCGAPAIAAA